jgi:hypothetical protein
VDAVGLTLYGYRRVTLPTPIDYPKS